MKITKQQLLDAVKMIDEKYVGHGEEVLYYFNDADNCGALSFFNIDYDNVKNEVNITNDFNVDEAMEIVNGYSDKVDGNNYKSKRSNEMVEKIDDYDKYTKSLRGGEDGTIDYCGLYMNVNLEVIKIVINNQNNEGVVK